MSGSIHKRKLQQDPLERYKLQNRSGYTMFRLYGTLFSQNGAIYNKDKYGYSRNYAAWCAAQGIFDGNGHREKL